MINVWLRLGSIPGPGSARYEALLIVKAVLFAAMIILAGVNRFRLTEQLAVGRGDPRKASKLLLISIAVEFAIGLSIFLAAALLGITAPSTAIA